MFIREAGLGGGSKTVANKNTGKNTGSGIRPTQYINNQKTNTPSALEKASNSFDNKMKQLEIMANNSAKYTGTGKPITNVPVQHPGSYNGFTPITNFTKDVNGKPNTPDQRVFNNAVNSNLATAKKGNSTNNEIYQAQKFYENFIKPSLPVNEPINYGNSDGNNNNNDSSSANYYDTSYLDAIRRLLQEQRDAQEKAANERYLALLGQYSDSYDSTRNAINLNNAYAKRWLNQMYGGENSGAGLSNQASLMSSMNNSLYNAKKAYEQNKANALANKYDEIANATNNYANNYNNYVLQPYSDLTKQAIANDDESFLKYLQKLGY